MGCAGGAGQGSNQQALHLRPGGAAEVSAVEADQWCVVLEHYIITLTGRDVMRLATCRAELVGISSAVGV